MKSRKRERPVAAVEIAAESGCPGCCMEAQADGVPCTEIRSCEQCGRAIRPRQAPPVLAPAS